MIVIRGMSAVSSCGFGTEKLVEHLRNRIDSSSPLTSSKASSWHGFDGLKVNRISPEIWDHSETINSLVIDVIKNAVKEARLADGEMTDSALIMGTSGLTFEAEAKFKKEADSGVDHPVPLAVPGTGRLASQISRELAFRGPALTITTACTSGANAILTAAGMLSSGEVKRAIVVGMDMLSALTLNGFRSFMLLSEEGCKPFDLDRKGIQLGEACATVILETVDKPSSQDRFILKGWANVCDTHSVISSNVNGQAFSKTMSEALEKAGTGAVQISAIKTHGVGSVDSDLAEASAIKSIFGGEMPPLTSFKGHLGHTVGASGVIETVAFLKCLEAGFIPATAGFNQMDPEIGLSLITDNMETRRGSYLFNFSGFGGSNTSFVISYG